VRSSDSHAAVVHHGWDGNPGSRNYEPSTVPLSFPTIPYTSMLILISIQRMRGSNTCTQLSCSCHIWYIIVQDIDSVGNYWGREYRTKYLVRSLGSILEMYIKYGNEDE